MELKIENCFWLDTNAPYVFLNENNDGLFLIKKMEENSFEYLDQKFFTKIYTFSGSPNDVVRLANEKERLAGHRL
ncbi:hypothetical protein [Acinetobacter sp. YH01006]|uniref:hypothetical protein n=1 Tax=Acinetobacter sp. YH01006 TaxID=2601022 RepID=UPI0015D232FA|nr:hypothetical protein [Acinetobacter sp. YH01006]